jgi:hypothetical protein
MVKENVAPAGGSLDDLKDLSSTEILTGILLFAGKQKFPEQALYEFFREVSSEDPELAKRFRVAGLGRGLRSEPLRRILDHLEMGKIIEVPLPNPVDQFYAVRASQADSLKKHLKDRGVLPTHEDKLKELGARFANRVAEFKARAREAAVPQTV